MKLEEKLKKIYETLDKKLADNIVVLDVNSITSIADYFVIVSASSERQVKSLEETVDYEMSKLGEYTISTEGRMTAKWILMDYSDIIVHIFKEDEREFYNIERLWKDAVRVDMEGII